MAVPVTCMTCSCPVDPARWNRSGLDPCPRCGTRLRADVFPAFFRETPKGRRGDLLVLDNEAACFFHPELRASVPCDACGRFICSLCDIELEDEHLCPVCLKRKRSDERDISLGSVAVLYDHIALALALAPLFLLIVCFPFPAVVTAPAAIFVALRYHDRIRSPVPRSRAVFILAFVVALAQVLLMIGGAALLTITMLDL